MTLTIELTPEQETQLAEAARKAGAEPTVLVANWIAEHLPLADEHSAPDAENQAAIDLLRSWQEEDATDDAEELARRDRETQTFLRNLASNRLALRTWEA
jgi:hypothetical protein